MIKGYDRQLARKMAGEYAAKTREGAKGGVNVHQLRIDLNDELQAFVSQFSVEGQTEFLTMYTQELEALAATAEDEAATTRANHEVWGKLIGGVIALIMVVVLGYGALAMIVKVANLK